MCTRPESERGVNRRKRSMRHDTQKSGRVALFVSVFPSALLRDENPFQRLSIACPTAVRCVCAYGRLMEWGADVRLSEKVRSKAQGVRATRRRKVEKRAWKAWKERLSLAVRHIRRGVKRELREVKVDPSPLHTYAQREKKNFAAFMLPQDLTIGRGDRRGDAKHVAKAASQRLR